MILRWWLRLLDSAADVFLLGVIGMCSLMWGVGARIGLCANWQGYGRIVVELPLLENGYSLPSLPIAAVFDLKRR